MMLPACAVAWRPGGDGVLKFRYGGASPMLYGCPNAPTHVSYPNRVL